MEVMEVMVVMVVMMVMMVMGEGVGKGERVVMGERVGMAGMVVMVEMAPRELVRVVRVVRVEMDLRGLVMDLKERASSLHCTLLETCYYQSLHFLQHGRPQ